MTRKRYTHSTDKIPPWLLIVVGIILPILSWVGGSVSSGWSIANSLADKPYVEKRFQESITYTDTKSAQILKEAFEHSDSNRQQTQLDMAKQQQAFMAEFSSFQTSSAAKMGAVEAALNGVQSAVREMRDSAWDEHLGRPHKPRADR